MLYCRLIDANILHALLQDFDDMKAYDVTGVGLNLGTADEFARKVRRESFQLLLPVDAHHHLLMTALGQFCASLGFQRPRVALCRWARPSRQAGSRRPTASGWSASSRRAAVHTFVHHMAAIES
jgi:hypothetical protein